MGKSEKGGTKKITSSKNYLAVLITAFFIEKI